METTGVILRPYHWKRWCIAVTVASKPYCCSRSSLPGLRNWSNRRYNVPQLPRRACLYCLTPWCPELRACPRYSDFASISDVFDARTYFTSRVQGSSHLLGNNVLLTPLFHRHNAVKRTNGQWSDLCRMSWGNRGALDERVPGCSRLGHVFMARSTSGAHSVQWKTRHWQSRTRHQTAKV